MPPNSGRAEGTEHYSDGNDRSFPKEFPNERYGLHRNELKKAPCATTLGELSFSAMS